MDKRRNGEVLRETLDLPGKSILDIGCGDGNLARMMAKMGAKVVGLEPSETQLAKAQSAEPINGAEYLQGSAMDLPFEDQHFDAVVFFNSLHHIPKEGRYKSLEEAARVVKTGGIVYICEPVASGPHFDLMRPVDDETEVRSHAYKQIGKAKEAGLNQVSEIKYEHTVIRGSYEEFRDKIIAPDPQRKAAFDALDGGLRDAFERLGTKTDKGYTFAQPMRVNVLKKA